MFCPNCGKVNADNAAHCMQCGAMLGGYPNGGQSPTNITYNQVFTTQTASSKSKVAAGLLGIFLGALGIHNFYLGFNKRAIIQLVISLVGSLLFGIGPVVMAIWGIVEGVMYLTGSKNKDADGNPLV